MNKHVIKKRFGIGTQSDGGMFLVGTPRIQQQRDIPLYVHEAIESPTDVVHHVDVMRQTEEGDCITMYVSGDGGCVSSVDLLLHEMITCQERGVTIHCICTGLVASAFTFIPLYASSFELSEGFHALLHAGSARMGGSLPEFKASSTFTVKYMESRLRSVYKHFLTEDELDDMLEGKDVWLDADGWIARYKTRNEILAAEMEEQECECGQCGVDEQQAEAEQQSSSLAPQEDKRSVPPPYAKRSRKKPEAQQES